MWVFMPFWCDLLRSTKLSIWYLLGDGVILCLCLPWLRSVFLPYPCSTCINKYAYSGSCAYVEDRICCRNWIMGELLWFGYFKAFSAWEGVLKFGGRVVDGWVADVFCLYAGEELGWAWHNKINDKTIVLSSVYYIRSSYTQKNTKN